MVSAHHVQFLYDRSHLRATQDGNVNVSTYFFERFSKLNSLVHILIFDLCTGLIFSKNYPLLWYKIHPCFVFIVSPFPPQNSFYHFFYLKRAHDSSGNIHVDT